MKRIPIILTVLFLCFFACNTPKQTVKESANKAPAALVNTRWVLKSMSSATIPVMEKDIYIQFQPNGALKGFAGCNGFTGIYTINTKSLTISRLLSTKMWCSHGSVETQVLKALQSTSGFNISGDELHLLSADKEVAAFNAVYLKE